MNLDAKHFELLALAYEHGAPTIAPPDAEAWTAVAFAASQSTDADGETARTAWILWARPRSENAPTLSANLHERALVQAVQALDSSTSILHRAADTVDRLRARVVELEKLLAKQEPA